MASKWLHSSFVLFIILPTILTQTLQKESCCSIRVEPTARTKVAQTISGCICKGVPDGYTICYNANNYQASCKTYPNRMKINTTKLVIRSTSIREILVNDFSNLNHIESLTIEKNTKLNHIQAFVFEKMTNLRTLNIISNPLLNSLHPDAFQGSVNLKELKIEDCGFSQIQDLTRALQVKLLPNLRTLKIGGNSFVHISADAFDSIGDGPLEESDLSSCGIQSIDRNASKSLRKLSKISLGNNSLEVQAIVDISETTISSGIDLTSLDLHSVGINTSVPESLAKVIASSNIDNLTLSQNTLDILNQKTIPFTLPNLRTLDITNVTANFLEDSFFTKVPNVEKLISSQHNLSYFTMPKALPNLKYLDLSEFTKKQPYEFFHLETELDVTKVEYSDLHHTRSAFLLADSFKFMPALKELNSKKCVIAKISTGAFNQLSNLKFLNLEDNKFFVMYIKYPSEPFLGLENLETLLVGGNAISYISKNEKNLFKYLTNLKCLGSQRNSLEVITAWDLEPSKNLEVLDISSNPSYAWDDRVFFKSKSENFYASSNHFNYSSLAMIQDFRNFTSLDIGYSPFSCDCRMMRRMFPDKILSREIKTSTRYRNLLCAGSHESTVIDYIETKNYSDCEPKKSLMMYFLWTFFAFASIAAILILVFTVRDQIPYANAFVRSSQGRQSIM